MWQKIQDDMHDKEFTVVAVAMDTAEAARPWIEAAKLTYPCLIDRHHHLGALYDLVNVPQAVWIDEQGRIVRPPENAGSHDGFRSMDRVTKQVAPAITAERARVKQVYMDAVRDWAANGNHSRHVPDQATAQSRLPATSDAMAEAHARFRLGQHLLARGNDQEATAQFAEASRLHPDSWCMWRQAAAKDPTGLATGPAFWARLDALGERHFYPPPAIEGIDR